MLSKLLGHLNVGGLVLEGFFGFLFANGWVDCDCCFLKWGMMSGCFAYGKGDFKECGQCMVMVLCDEGLW